MDLVNDLTPPSQAAIEGPPLGTCWIRLKQDRRPLTEHGRVSYMGESYVLDQDFKVPVAESILAVLARDTRRAGLFTGTSLYDKEQALRLDVTIERASATFVEGLPSLIPLVPASALEATVKLRLALLDRDGRVFIDQMFERSESGVGAAVEGLEDAAATILGRAIRGAVDDAIPALRAAHAAYWERVRLGPSGG